MARPPASTNSAPRPPKAAPASEAPALDSPAEPSAAAFDREQAIREMAYACFEARGCEPGHELDDWLQAEAQVQQARGSSGPTTH